MHQRRRLWRPKLVRIARFASASLSSSLISSTTPSSFVWLLVPYQLFEAPADAGLCIAILALNDDVLL